MRVRWIWQQEDRFDPGKIAVDNRHGCFVGDIHLRANALHEHGRAHIRAVVHEQTDTPRRDADVAAEAGIRDRLLDQGDPLGHWQQRGFVRIVHDEHMHFVEEASSTVDHVEVTKCDGVEGPGNDGDPVHPPTLSFVASIIQEVVGLE